MTTTDLAHDGSGGTFHAHLKAATSTVHAALDRELDLMSPALTRERYGDVLERMLGYYEPLEALLFTDERWPVAALAREPRRKSHLLRADLLALGRDPDSAPQCTTTPRLPDRGQALGCLYVLEGATLGGQVITRHVRTLLDVTTTTGGRFFAGYGEHTGAMWRDFVRVLNTGTDMPEVQLAVIEGARATFDTLRTWCQGADPSRDVA